MQNYSTVQYIVSLIALYTLWSQYVNNKHNTPWKVLCTEFMRLILYQESHWYDFWYVKSGRPHFKIITIHFIEVSMDVAQPRSQILSFPHAKGKEKDPGSGR